MNFIDANENLLKELHLKRDEVIGKNVTDISPDIANTERYQIYQDVLLTGKSKTIDNIRLHPSLGNYGARICVFKVGEGLGLASLNISDLKDANDELETFIYKSSHDMRTPISSILGLVNVALNDSKNMNTAFEYLSMIKHQAERLDYILQKLFDTARIKKGEKIIYYIDFKKIIDEVQESLSTMHGFYTITFNTKINVNQKFYNDRLLIICIFQNIIDNAIKYRNQHIYNSYINISVDDENSGVKIILEDNGIGIPENIQNDVFKMFFRGTNTASGAGLGLYTVKHCIKKLNGHISLATTKDGGTAFTIFVPNEDTPK